MRIAIFAHSWLSDWNHGNAHFLRGLARALVGRGHRVRGYEPLPGPFGDWSLANLFRNQPLQALGSVLEVRRRYPELDLRFYPTTDVRMEAYLAEELRDTEFALVHEWSPPGLLACLLKLRSRRDFALLWYDTHHRAATAPEAFRSIPFQRFEAVLVFGQSLARLYRQQFGLKRCWVLHEAADETVFSPLGKERRRQAVWIGNWGDEERTGLLHEFLLTPARRLSPHRFQIYGVRYPPGACAELAAAGVRYGGYLPNLAANEIYNGSAVTMHLPRGPYRDGLRGIPTIRVFEALASGCPLVCAPWRDEEHLFTEGEDYLAARDGAEMTAYLAAILASPESGARLAEHGRATIEKRHTCAHRAQELEAICKSLN